MGIFSRLFSKQNDNIGSEELSDMLISADVSQKIAFDIARKTSNKESLKKVLIDFAKKLEPKYINPKSILILGVNGAGKTTTVGKLAHKFIKNGNNVIIGACDTFRAASNEQLDIWAEKTKAQIIHGKEPAEVAYKTIESMNNKSIAILDTAGRLHNRTDLMNEISKIARVIKKIDQNAPTDVWLVLDGTTGQNGLAQIEYFNKAVPLSGLIVTKMDGTSKAGFLISYAAEEKNPLPVIYVGYGESVSDLKSFDAEEYVEKMLV